MRGASAGHVDPEDPQFEPLPARLPIQAHPNTQSTSLDNTSKCNAIRFDGIMKS
jgi:hypothetical protein